jgi:hypothetical protein
LVLFHDIKPTNLEKHIELTKVPNNKLAGWNRAISVLRGYLSIILLARMNLASRERNLMAKPIKCGGEKAYIYQDYRIYYTCLGLPNDYH